MRKYNLLIKCATFGLATLFLLANLVAAQYWFQTGVRGSNDAGFNNGAGVSIQTVYQNATNGSLGFWVGEDLSNGAFIQAGYEITNSTGYYSSSCGNNTRSVYLQAGTPTWFWEYFPENYNNSSFCGGIGPNGSAGKNSSFNTYSFKSTGNIWSAYFNGDQIGSVNLGTGNSGANPPSAFAEYAQTNSNRWKIETVQFKNLVFYMGNSTRQVPEGFSAVSYGKGSLTALPNPYGVQEVGNFVNYFEVGSAIPTTQKVNILWKFGYSLLINSTYGNATGGGNYIAYSVVPLSVPADMNISNGIREQFISWIGTGSGSYTGNSPQASITLNQNVTETAIWKKQYYLSLTTQYGNVTGTGWYNANSSVPIIVKSDTVNTGTGSRVIFQGWSSGSVTNRTLIDMDQPRAISAVWKNQYYITVVTQYGNVTGSGWYDSGSVANLSVTNTLVPVNATSRYGLYGWSNGATGKTIDFVVNAPQTVSTVFRKEYLVTLVPQDSYGRNITNVSFYNVSSNRINSSGQLFVFEGKTYVIEYIYFKGVPVVTNYNFSATEPEEIKFKTPIYNIAINTQSVFGTPINASLNITFRNNTNVVTHSGRSGIETFNDVPYGYAAGYAEYFGIRESVNAVNGFSPYLTFLTAALFAFIIGGILFIVAVALVTTHYAKRKALAK